MANLVYSEVLLIAAVASVGFTLLAYGYSAWMERRGHNYQVKGKRKPAKP